MLATTRTLRTVLLTAAAAASLAACGIEPVRTTAQDTPHQAASSFTSAPRLDCGTADNPCQLERVTVTARRS